MPSLKAPALPNLISKDVPDINLLLNSLAKMDYAGVTDIPVNAVRFNRTTKLFEIYNGTTWVSAGKLGHDVETVDGYSANAGQVANTIPVRDANKKIPGDITGKAATAGSADTLSATLPVSKGGTGATTSASARANLGVSYGSAAGTVVQGNDSRVVNALNKTGDTMTGNLGLAANSVLILANTTAQERIRFWGTSYTMGVQTSTLYLRTGGALKVYKGGVHHASAVPGEGGVELMHVTTNGEIIIPGRIETGQGAYFKGNILYNVPGQTHGVVQPLRFRADGGVTDTTVMLQGNGLMLVGSGEAATTYYAKYGPPGTKALNDSTEILGLLSDSYINFVTNLQNSATGSEFRAQMNASGTFYPMVNDSGSIGGDSNGWRGAYIFNYHTMPSTATDRSWVKIWPRERKTTTAVFYLEANGNDSYSGVDPAKPMKTFSSLMSRIYTEYDFNRSTIQIKIGKGTWSNQQWTIYTDKITNAANIEIIGDSVTTTILNPSADGTGRVGFNIEGPPSVYSVRIKNMQITNATDAMRVRRGVVVYLGAMQFGPAFAANTGSHVWVNDRSRVLTTWEASAGKLNQVTHACGAKPPRQVYLVNEEARLNLDYVKMTVTSSAASNYFAEVTHGGWLYIYDATRTVFDGTGLKSRRLNVNNFGKILTSSRGEKVFPANQESNIDYATGGYVNYPYAGQILGGGWCSFESAPKLWNAFGNIASVSNDAYGNTKVNLKSNVPGNFLVFLTSSHGASTGATHTPLPVLVGPKGSNSFIIGATMVAEKWNLENIQFMVVGTN